MAIAAGRVAAWAVARVTAANHVIDVDAYPDRGFALREASERNQEERISMRTVGAAALDAPLPFKVFALVEVDEP